MITVTCKQCGKEFESYEVHERVFCSRDCYNKFRKGKNVWIKVCKRCGKEFRSYREGREYCSRECKTRSKLKPKASESLDVAEHKGKGVCSTCKFCVRFQGNAEDRHCLECANPISEYYGALLNIDENGIITKEIWPRCNKWTGKGGGR